jgi:chromosome segregation ATPase
MKNIKPPKKAKGSQLFTPTEVGTLLENINESIKTIAEGHTGLAASLERLEMAVDGNTRRLDQVELRLSGVERRLSGVERRLSEVESRMSRFEDALLKLSKDLRETREELKTEIADTRTELKKDIHGLGERLSAVEVNR